MPQPPSLHWTQPEWLQTARAWIEQALTASGFHLTGPVDQFHARLWSTVMRVPTTAGLLYFKACDPPTEPRLTAFLSEVQPQNLPELVAVDLERGWMLMHDGGPMLRTYLSSPADLTLMEPAMRQYAQLQLAVVDRVARLETLGAPRRDLDGLPAAFAALLEEMDLMRLGEPDGLTMDQHRELSALVPHYTRLCHALADFGLPLALHHDDFHDGNIFVTGQPGSFRFIFSDWGESLVTHPFFSIMLCLRVVASRAGLPDAATETPEGLPSELKCLRDAYLQPWQVYTSAEQLVQIFNTAWRVGMVSRALTWRGYIQSLPSAQRSEFTYIVPAWLGEFRLAMQAGTM